LDTDEGDRRFDAFMQTFIAQRRGPGDRDALTARGYTDGQGCGSSDRRGYGDDDLGAAASYCGWLTASHLTSQAVPGANDGAARSAACVVAERCQPEGVLVID
jgi:hypothetical protein